MRSRSATQLKRTFRRAAGPPAAARLITDGALVTDDDVWAWVQIPDGSTDLYEDEQLASETMELAQTLARLVPANGDYHLKVLWSRHSGVAYEEGWSGLDGVRATHADEYIELGAHRIDMNAFPQRVVLFGVRWPSASTPDNRGGLWSDQLRSRAARQRSAHQRLADAQTTIDQWLAAMSGEPVRAIPAPAGVLAWSYAREMRRGTVVELPPTQMLNAPQIALLLNGSVDPRENPRYVVTTDARTGLRRYVSILVSALDGFPATELYIPGGEWLQTLTQLEGVEASVRGTHHGQAGSLAVLDTGRKAALSQLREAEEHGGQAPLDVAEAEQVLADRRHEITRRLDVETTNHIRLVVDADTPEDLDARIAEVINHYGGLGIVVDAPAHVQDLLWCELLPGDQVRVTEYAQDQPMRTLAGSWFHGGSAVGDTSGPYIGGNLGSTPGPIQLRLASRTAQHRTQPTTMLFTGQTGSGKSTAVMMQLLAALAEGAWSLLVDYKGDLGGLATVASTVLQVPVQEIHGLHENASGTMDPLRYVPDPDMARTMALDAMLGVLSPDDRQRAESVLETAIDRVMRRPVEGRSSPGVIAELLAGEHGDRDRALAEEIGGTLTMRAKHPLARPLLGHLAPAAVPLATGRGLVYLRMDGLQLPNPGTDPSRWDMSQRLSMATMTSSLRYASLMSRHSREMLKVVAFTELHLITPYAEGRATVEWLARVGRALKCFVLLDSQSAIDLATITGLVEQTVMVWCGRAVGLQEQDAQAALLTGTAHAGPRMRAQMAAFGPGQGLLRDRARRVAPMEWDRLSSWIADRLATDAGEDSAAVSPVDGHSTPTPASLPQSGF
ncbi:ATP-binding protein [Kibdelosporangium phytohabitans]|uniref:Uncharacterized protein n=1 Tax=Kibdelosporangium phytohabitans TaxID=860235 RepID=A0A0N9HW66_9PSEU|nr:ATP-binding protein [Kibdelosporangium phytohabitans]ALG06373.1 hypothetical protein AOZ06_05040 [Kibdelosporangium phytohabitans]MBE1467516.1 hypothetical protein [Kibdelosporangium phytohabitans]